MNISHPKIKQGVVLRWGIITIFIFVIFSIVINILIILNGKNNSYSDINKIKTHYVAVVFGTTPKMMNGLPNSYYTYRIRGAVDLYKEGKVKKILVSGDNRTFRYNEPRAMRNSLEERGVKSADIIEDYAGRDTYDSVIRARDVFGIHEPLYVTQKFQADRALSIAKWNSINASAYVVPETKNIFVRLKIYTREYLARIKMIFSLLLNIKPDVVGKYEPITQLYE